MTANLSEHDGHFEANLSSFGARMGVPPGMPEDVRGACQESLRSSGGIRRVRVLGTWRPALLSTLGLAAALGLVVGLLFPMGGGPTVQAAIVLEKLATQVQGDDVLEIVLDAVSVDEVSVQGRIQVSDKAIAGDILATIRDGDGPVEVDASLAVSEAGGWVLLRKLSVPVEPAAAAIIAGFFPPGTETLLTFPADKAAAFIEQEIGDEAASGLGELRALATGQLVTFLKEVIKSHSDVGATVTNQADGTVLVSITVRDAESLRKLLVIAKSAMGEDTNDGIDIEEDDAAELYGCTLRVVYDPKAETVRSFSISNVGEMKGTVTISLRGGAMDPALLESARVTTPNTRTFDVGALMSIVQSFQNKGEPAE